VLEALLDLFLDLFRNHGPLRSIKDQNMFVRSDHLNRREIKLD